MNIQSFRDKIDFTDNKVNNKINNNLFNIITQTSPAITYFRKTCYPSETNFFGFPVIINT